MKDSKIEAHIELKDQVVTHTHKKIGPVVVLQSTPTLAKILTPKTQDQFWVKIADLTEVEAPKAKRN